MKEEEKAPEKELNEMEANDLLDIELKIMVIKMLMKLRTTRNLVRTTTDIKKDIETITKNQSEMKNTISEMKNTLE